MTVGCIEVPLEDAKGFGVMSIDADRRVVRFDEKPRQPAADAGPHRRARSRAWASTSSTRSFLYEQLVRDADDPKSSHDFGKDIIPLADRPRLPGVRAPLRRQLREHERGPPVLARRRHHRRVLGGEHRPHQRRRRTSTSTTTTGRSGPTRSSCRRPSSCSTTTSGAALAIDSMVSGGCIISGAQRAAARCCSPTCACTATARIEDSVILPRLRHRPPLRDPARDHRQELPASRRARASASIPRRTAPLPRHRARRHAGDARHARPAGARRPVSDDAPQPGREATPR